MTALSRTAEQNLILYVLVRFLVEFPNQRQLTISFASLVTVITVNNNHRLPTGSGY